ncbi:Sucrose nonfermenting 4-like protein [Zea mays]|uniref:Sucrose nonfermenting 4-like protein n=1 Tax=Zea mays TaxID=4577 RepID=A0A1D6J6D5_MAIZE|nr:Sucrose nonfermenting 4-like protein [Zea mays]
MVLQRFSWPYGGRSATFCGSFTGWRECPMGLVGAVFQVVFDLPPGVYQYRFLVDGVWRCDETKPFVRDEYGLISNEVLVENNVQPVVQPEPSIRGTNMDKGTILKTMPPEPSSQNPSMQIAVIRHVVSGILLHNTIYDVVPLSSKLTVLDTQLPVKQAFKIMHDEVCMLLCLLELLQIVHFPSMGLALVPLWDDRQGTITGMLTASDFVLILRKLQRNIQVIGNEEPISAWKEAKLQFYGGPDGAAMQRRPLIHVKDSDNLVDVALTIIRNEISSVPIFKCMADSSGVPFLNLATLQGILKFLCSKLQEEAEGCSLLHNQLLSIPIGTWSPHTGRSSSRQLRTLLLSSPLNTCLDILLQDRVSSIPIVDDNGSLRDVYSLRCMAEDSVILVYRRVPCWKFWRDCPFQLILFLYKTDARYVLSSGVRRLVVIEQSTRFVEGIISLRDVFTFLLG